MTLTPSITALCTGTMDKIATGAFFLCLCTASCTGSPRYTRAGDSLDIYTPQRLERRIRCRTCKDSTSSSNSRTGKKKRDLVKTGKASYYGPKFHGRKTASGEIFDQHAFTAAHRFLPFGTMVTVTNKLNNRTVTVRINDRGPAKRNRIIDISYAAAEQIDMITKGIVPVSIDTVSTP